MKCLILFLVLFLFLALPVNGNFMGFERAKLGAFCDTINVLQNNTIRFVKERLYFKLGQTVQFRGKYWFSNETHRNQKLVLGFPQESFWDVPFNKEKQGYFPGRPNSFTSQIALNGKIMNKIEERYTRRIFDFSKPIQFLSEKEMTSSLVDYANNNEAESTPSMPVLIWKIFDCLFPANSTTLIEVEFTMSWFYEDEIWSDNIHTNGSRSFKYITSTAQTWAGGSIKDFQTVVDYPLDVGGHLKLNPKGWTSIKPNRSLLSQSDFKPGPSDSILFEWRSDFALSSGSQTKSCWDSLYYKDFHWRFLSDHSDETTWAFDQAGLECPEFEIRGLNVQTNGAKRTATRKINKVRIVSGWARSQSDFFSNNRPKTMEFFFKGPKGKRTQVVHLKDTRLPQIFPLDQPGTIPHAFRIIDVYKSKSSQEVFISELSFHD